MGIDPGHGGQDRGVRVDGFTEADFTLNLAGLVRDALRNLGQAAVLSRNGDVDLSNTARVQWANQAHLACLVSLHANYSFSPASSGVRVFVPPASAPPQVVSNPDGGAGLPILRWGQASALNAAASRRLGQDIAAELEAGSAQKRGVQSLKLALFRGLVPPACLVECGFASNPGDLAKLKDPQHARDLAREIAQGIERYLGSPAPQ